MSGGRCVVASTAPCHAPGYKTFALNDRGGTRSAVVIVPTEPGEAIGAAFEAAVATAVCRMLDRDP